MLMEVTCMRRGHPGPRLDMLIHHDNEEGQTGQRRLLHPSLGAWHDVP